MRCFKARDGNGWQVSQQHTIAWRLAEYIVRHRRRLHTGGEAAARQWRWRHTAQQAGSDGNGGPDRVHCRPPPSAPSTQTRPKASFGRWKAVLLCTLLLLPPSAACRHCCSFLLSLQNAPDLGEATSLVDMAPTRTLYYYYYSSHSLSLLLQASHMPRRAHIHLLLPLLKWTNLRLFKDFQLYVIFQKTQFLIQVGIWIEINKWLFFTW